MAVMQLKDKNTKKPIKDKQGRSWYFKTYYTSLTGERKQYKSKKFLSKHEAEEAERIFILNSTGKVETKSLTFLELIEIYEEDKKDEVKITTYNNYKKNHKYLKPLYKIKVKDFNIPNFKNWKAEINKLDLTTSYKNNIYKFLRALLNYAENMYDINLTDVLKK